MRTSTLLILLSIAAASAGAAAACDDGYHYVYTAQRWNDASGCLEDYTPIEVVPGDGVSSNCPALCLTVGEDLYVSTVCPPLPSNATAADPQTSPCKEALAAAAKEISCSAGDASDGDASDDGASDDGAGDEGDAGSADDGAAPPGDAATD
jgi:hypothetical protein